MKYSDALDPGVRDAAEDYIADMLYDTGELSSSGMRERARDILQEILWRFRPDLVSFGEGEG